MVFIRTTFYHILAELTTELISSPFNERNHLPRNFAWSFPGNFRVFRVSNIEPLCDTFVSFAFIVTLLVANSSDLRPSTKLYAALTGEGGGGVHTILRYSNGQTVSVSISDCPFVSSWVHAIRHKNRKTNGLGCKRSWRTDQPKTKKLRLSDNRIRSNTGFRELKRSRISVPGSVWQWRKTSEIH